MVHPQPGTHTRSRQSKIHHHAPIDLLPDHTLLQIFSHLSTNQLCRCARVCRRWYNLAWDPRLWGTIRLTGELLHVDRAIRVLTHRLCQDTPNVCLTLETVMVNGCKRLTDRGLYVLAQCCPELRRLEVAGCYNISNDAVFEVVSRCPNLEHLNLSGKKETKQTTYSTCVLVNTVKSKSLNNRKYFNIRFFYSSNIHLGDFQFYLFQLDIFTTLLLRCILYMWLHQRIPHCQFKAA